jgi:hypothetical protein
MGFQIFQPPKANVKGAQLKELMQDLSAKALKRGKALRFFSDRGGLVAALRRAITNSAACSLGLALSIDAHGTTIADWERRLRGAQLESFRAWTVAK